MRLWVDGAPGLEDPPEELAEKAWRALTSRPGGSDLAHELKLPVYSYKGLSVRIRFVHELPPEVTTATDHAIPGPAVSTLAWFWVHVLEGLLWESAGQVAELHARREWGRVAGVEITV